MVMVRVSECMAEVAGLSSAGCETSVTVSAGCSRVAPSPPSSHALAADDNFHVGADKCQPYYCHDDDDDDRLRGGDTVPISLPPSRYAPQEFM